MVRYTNEITSKKGTHEASDTVCHSYIYIYCYTLEDDVLFKAAFVVEQESIVSAYFCFGSHFWN